MTPEEKREANRRKSKAWRERNPEEYRESHRQSDKKYWEKNRAERAEKNLQTQKKRRAWLAGIKAIPCTDCGKLYPACVMDFDHVRGKKLFGIGQGSGKSLSVLLAEIAKCDIVCSNCHRIRTELRRKSDAS